MKFKVGDSFFIEDDRGDKYILGTISSMQDKTYYYTAAYDNIFREDESLKWFQDGSKYCNGAIKLPAANFKLFKIVF